MDPDSSIAEVHKRLASTPEKVFAAFADPKMVARWLKPAPEIKLRILQFEFRVGGRYRFAYQVPVGARVVIGGVFLSIKRPEILVFTWIIEAPDEHAGIESEVAVTIAPDREGADLLIRHTKLGRTDAIERHHGGWIGAVGLLETLLKEQVT